MPDRVPINIIGVPRRPSLPSETSELSLPSPNVPLNGTASHRQSKRFRTIMLLAMFSVATFTCFSSFSERRLRRFLCQRRKLSANRDGVFLDTLERVLDNYEKKDECNTAFPTTVQARVGEAYYTDPTADSGVYYADVIPHASLRNDGDASAFGLVPEDDEAGPIDQVDKTVLDSFRPKEYAPVATTSRPTDTVAYVVTITNCPHMDEPGIKDVSIEDPEEDLYEASAVLNYCVCNTTEELMSEDVRRNLRASNARNGRRLSHVNSDNHTMYAVIHPRAINCIGQHGNTYNRVSLLQSQGYHVEILGEPVTKADITFTQPHIEQNIDEDVGIRDTMIMHAWRLHEHRAVVVMDYDTQLLHSVRPEIDDLISDPFTEVKYVRDADGGVSNTFMILKPSEEKYEQFRQEYINTLYDPNTGWGGEGHNTMEGKLGVKGFFSYHASKTTSWKELDRCTYNNELDDECINKIDVEDSKVAKHSKKVCGMPRDCPYDHPMWSFKKRNQCQKLHSRYFKARYEFEKYFLFKNVVQERIGQFKPGSFLGYCKGPGKKNYMKLTNAIEIKPKWQKICPPIECPRGRYVKDDCTCTTRGENPCAACPTGTRCQRYPELRCIDCSCGFCNDKGASCCEFSGGNKCSERKNNGDSCHVDHFPSFMGNELCSGLGISEYATYNGCGCKPNQFAPCTYNRELQDTYDPCYHCTTQQVLDGTCPSCKECLSECKGGECVNQAKTAAEMAACLEGGTFDFFCRSQCNNKCTKASQSD